MKTEKVLLYLGIAFALYLVYTKLKSVANLPANIGISASNSLFDALNPPSKTGNVYHTVIFPDGTSHAIDAGIVAADNTFDYQGQNYTLAQGASGAYAAFLTASVLVPSGTVDSNPNSGGSMTSADLGPGGYGRLGRMR